jgi:thiol-disulfide isomerase/thioredoxin
VSPARILPVLAVLSALACGLPGAGRAAEVAPFWYDTDPRTGAVTIDLYFFWSETCPHCARAHPFVEDLAEARPWLDLHALQVTGSPMAREWFGALAERVGAGIQGVPTFFACGEMLVGYDTPGGMGRRLERLVDRCHAALTADTAGAASQTTDAAEGPAAGPAPVEIPLLGTVSPEALSLPVLTVVLGGLDAFNPCAFFVLLFLLSLMVHARSRARMLAVGGLFVLVSGLLYFAFMAAWLNLFLVVGGLWWITTVAGAVAVVLALVNIKDFVWFRQGVTLSIPENRKPGLFARMRGLISAESLPAMLAGTAALAVAANTYELLCTTGFPLVYTRALTLQDLSTPAYYLYLAAYNVVYVLPLLAIVIVVTATLGARKLSEAQGRVLKLLSGLMMLGLGVVLLAAPDLLDTLLTAVALLAGAGLVTAVAVWIDRRRRPRASAAHRPAG